MLRCAKLKRNGCWLAAKPRLWAVDSRRRQALQDLDELPLRPHLVPSGGHHRPSLLHFALRYVRFQQAHHVQPGSTQAADTWGGARQE